MFCNQAHGLQAPPHWQNILIYGSDALQIKQTADYSVKINGIDKSPGSNCSGGKNECHIHMLDR